MRGAKLFVLFLSVFVIGSSFVAVPVTSEKSVNDFALKNIDGKILSLKNYPAAKGFIIVFTCNHCPFAKLYAARLNELNSRFSRFNVPLIAVNSSDTVMFADETIKGMAEMARSKKINFPYLSDASQVVGQNFQADKTPHAFVIWKEQNKWIVKYSGAIDDNGANAKDVKVPFVANALQELLGGKPVSIPNGRSIGCAIHYRNGPRMAR